MILFQRLIFWNIGLIKSIAFVLVLGAYSKVINFCKMMWCRGPTRHNLTKSGPQPNHKSAFILFAWCFLFLVLKASCEWNVNIFIYILKLNKCLNDPDMFSYMFSNVPSVCFSDICEILQFVLILGHNFYLTSFATHSINIRKDTLIL